MKKIVIKGKEYPARITMGAMLRFKRETGRDISEAKSTDVSDMVVFLFCVVEAASHDEGVPFPFTLEEFADALTPDSLTILEGESTEGEAKKKTE